MNFLVVEDDAISATLLKSILSPYGSCTVAVTGKAGVLAFQKSLKTGSFFSLVCLDIMLPEMDGQEVLKNIRDMEKDKGILGLDGAKIVMITALNDNKNIMEAFRSQCEGYIVKPIRKERVVEQLKALGLV